MIRRLAVGGWLLATGSQQLIRNKLEFENREKPLKKVNFYSITSSKLRKTNSHQPEASCQKPVARS